MKIGTNKNLAIANRSRVSYAHNTLRAFIVSKKSKKSIYIAHRRETFNALNASVCCEQKRLQRLSETVPANDRVTQVVRQGIPDRRTSHTESPSAIGAELSW